MVTCGVSETLWLGWLKLSCHHVMSMEKDAAIQDPTDFSELMVKLIGRFNVREVIDSSVKIDVHFAFPDISVESV